MPLIATENEKADLWWWRYEALVRAGYPSDVATVLADRPTVDLHAACDLLLSGCNVPTALRILS